jgi:hypothetical protein
MSVQRKWDKFESRWIAAGLYSENVVSNQICYRVKWVIKAKNLQPVIFWTYCVPQADRITLLFSKCHWNIGMLRHIKTNLKNRLCIRVIRVMIFIWLTRIYVLFISIINSLCCWIHSPELLWQINNWLSSGDSRFTLNFCYLKECTWKTSKLWTGLRELYLKPHTEFMTIETQGHRFFPFSLL